MIGPRARLGCIIPSTNTVVESEFNRMKPDGVSVHAARAFMLQVTLEELRKLADNAEQAARDLATAQVKTIVFACTSGSFFGGPSWERDLVTRLERVSSTRVITTSGAVTEALKTLGCRKITLVTPYTDAINQREQDFLVQKGFDVLGVRGLQRVVNTEIGRLTPQDAYRLAKETFVPGSDALFISCTDFRTIEVIDQFEFELDVPVVSSNQASFWHALRTSGITDAVKGYGQLFQH